MNKNIKIYLYTSFFILGLLGFSTVFGQEQPSLRERADQLYYEYQYAKATPIYLKLIEDNKATLQDRERLADSYYKMNNYGKAENSYAELVKHKDSGVENLLIYAKVLKQNSRYAEAKKVFLDYVEKTGNKSAVAHEIAGCDSALLWIANPTLYTVVNEEAVNTGRSEFSAYPIGERVYFASESNTLEGHYGWTGNPYLNLYTVDRSNGLLANPVLAEEINKGEYHVGPISSDREGNTLYVTRTYLVDNGQPDKYRSRKYLTNRLGLVVYQKNANGEWNQESFEYNNIGEYSVGHASLSPDGNVLYFVSDMPGGLGGTDIWYTEKQRDGSWGQPVNAGSIINTPQDELFPNIAEDGTLYYSSNGLPGMGGLDIFSSTGSKNQWADAINLRYPVNSAGDDFAFVSSSVTERGIKGYLSSNRQGGKGGDDIYSFSYEKPKPKLVLALKGIAYNKDTRELLPEVSVSLYRGGEQLVGEKSSDGQGSVFFELEKEADYKLVGEKHNYFGDSTVFSTRGLARSDTLFAPLYLEPIFVVGKTYTLENIHYDFDKHNIRKDAAEILDGLLKTMKENPTLKIELASHTDSRGSDSYNLALSQRRAQSAVDYLISRGIARDRMVAKGYGETRLLNECANGVKCSDEAHQANRRTEFTVLEF